MNAGQRSAVRTRATSSAARMNDSSISHRAWLMRPNSPVRATWRQPQWLWQRSRRAQGAQVSSTRSLAFCKTLGRYAQDSIAQPPNLGESRHSRPGSVARLGASKPDFCGLPLVPFSFLRGLRSVRWWPELVSGQGCSPKSFLIATTIWQWSTRMSAPVASVS